MCGQFSTRHFYSQDGSQLSSTDCPAAVPCIARNHTKNLHFLVVSRLISHLYPAHTSSPSSPKCLATFHWKLLLIHPNHYNLMPSNVPALVPKYNAYSSMLTSDLITDLKMSNEKSFLHLIFCCWIETSPDIYSLISMNNDKLQIGWNSRLSPKIRPKSKLTQTFLDAVLRLKGGGQFHFNYKLILHTMLLSYYLLFIPPFFPPQTSVFIEYSSYRQNYQYYLVSFGLVRNKTLKCEHKKENQDNNTHT